MLATLLVVACGILAFVVLRDDDEQDGEARVVELSETLEPRLERLDAALDEAQPGNRASLVAMRAAAERAAEELGDAEDELRLLGSEARGDPGVQAFEDAVVANRTLAEALASPRLSAAAIAGLQRQATATIDDLLDASLPELDASRLVAALRRQQRARSRPAPAPTTPQPTTSPAPTPAAVEAPSYRQHSAFGYQAQIPTGAGWSEPADSQPTPGRLFRTNVRGPAGMFVIVDYTPEEPAAFGGSYETRQDVGQTAFGSAVEYVFQGGRLPECQRARCVDYIINDPASDSGFGVLAGGSDFELAKQIANTVAESLIPQSYGE